MRGGDERGRSVDRQRTGQWSYWHLGDRETRVPRKCGGTVHIMMRRNYAMKRGMGVAAAEQNICKNTQGLHEPSLG